MPPAERIRTTHVGSLARPPDLVALAAEAQRDPTQTAAYEERLRAAVTDVVRRQRETGLDIINDGEFGKSAWHAYMNERLSGFEREPCEPVSAVRGKDARDFPEFYALADIGLPPPRPWRWVVTGPIAYTGQAAIARDVADLKAAAAGLDVDELFMAAVAPSSVARYYSTYYASEEDALLAVADALNVEYRAIVDAGFILQIDDAQLAVTHDLMVPPSSLAAYLEWVEVRIAALNRALAGIPPERTRYHLCWGSWNAPHASDVELKHLIDLLLQVRVGGYALEMANPRHEHEWRLWERVKLPPGRILIPGVVSHATNIVEHPELVAERIVRLAKLVGRENVVAGTDCGFSQVAGKPRVHPSIMWAKLGALVEGARLATRELWGRRSAA